MNLKLNTLALVLSCTAAFSATAQQSIGVQAGVGITRVRSGFWLNEGAPVVRMNLGLTYQRFISEHLTLGADLLYQQRGWRDRVTVVDVNNQPTGTALVPFRYEYAALPVKIGYRSVNEKAGFGFVRVGVVPALFLKATSKNPTADGYKRVELYDFNKNFDIAGLVEAGGGWRLNERMRLEAGGAFQYSFITFSKAFGGQHYGLSANLGLRYELGSKTKPAAGE